ncbi:LANO_0H24762g1_1 [Lachancea nothofagi CBS 11611]|uniref:Serine/threonine-protein phosphatase 2A activator n=1 Tax=Lachancea nothofagi CBS 11611 TaxID=1266666 RepID=A0A1G4KNZ5_9SACH|nr:LANO_0H24762g1_1 [Lachancea nothofagi CBS 11611]
MNSGVKPVTIDVSTTSFEEPTKRIFDSRGTQIFQKSLAIYRLKLYLNRYVSAMSGEKIDRRSKNPRVMEFAEILVFLSSLVDETPALPGPRRYGNLACRTWHDKLEEKSGTLLRNFVPLEYHKTVVELKYYFVNSFGSRERLDYGTGHELAFFALVVALDMLGIWGPDLTGSDLLFLFCRYYSLVRKLVLTYTLEPAGSHGVWGLDDHFHLIYIFGASQWADGRTAPASPKDMQNNLIVAENAGTNLYCQALSFVFKVKSGKFSEHSPMLYDISQTVPTWSKVQRGLLKMYFVEVLNKFPVVQHFWFGRALFPWVSLDNVDLPTYEAALETQLPHIAVNVTEMRHPMNPPNFPNANRFISHDRFKRG